MRHDHKIKIGDSRLTIYGSTALAFFMNNRITKIDYYLDEEYNDPFLKAIEYEKELP